MTPEQFRTALASLHLTQATLAFRLIELGDDRPHAGICRILRRWVAPGGRVPAWGVVILRLLALEQAQRRRIERTEQERDIYEVEAAAERAMAR